MKEETTLDNAATDIEGIRIKDKIEIDENFFKAYLEKHINRYWTNYKDFGAVSAAIIVTIVIIMEIGYIINIIMNTLQIKNVVGCSYKPSAALFSAATNKILRKADRNPETKTQEADNNDIELGEIKPRKKTPSKLPIPKPKKRFVRFIPTRLTNKKIQTSVRYKKKRSTETQLNMSSSED